MQGTGSGWGVRPGPEVRSRAGEGRWEAKPGLHFGIGNHHRVPQKAAVGPARGSRVRRPGTTGRRRRTPLWRGLGILAPDDRNHRHGPEKPPEPGPGTLAPRQPELPRSAGESRRSAGLGLAHEPSPARDGRRGAVPGGIPRPPSHPVVSAAGTARRGGLADWPLPLSGRFSPETPQGRRSWGPAASPGGASMAGNRCENSPPAVPSHREYGRDSPGTAEPFH